MLILALSLALTTPGAFAAGGQLDPSFGDGGIVRTDFGTAAFAVAIEVLPDGAIVAGGSTIEMEATGPVVGPGNISVSSTPVLVRYRPDGTLDPRFGDAGKVVMRVPDAEGLIRSLVVLPDGRIVVAGSISSSSFMSNSQTRRGFFLARFTPEGRIDLSFGSGGWSLHEVGRLRHVSSLGLQSDGRLILAGTRESEPRQPVKEFIVARFDPDGQPDQSFGADGQVEVDFADLFEHAADSPGRNAVAAEAMIVQPDNKIVVVGGTGTPSSAFAVARLEANGMLDASFGHGGRAVTPLEEIYGAADVVLGSDGSIVAGGSAGPGVALVRYRPDGTLDHAFGQSGLAYADLGGDVVTRRLAMLPDNRLLVAGGIFSDVRVGSRDVVILRFTADGMLDPSFGDSGRLVLDLGGQLGAEPTDMAIQPDGRVLMAAMSDDFVIARLLGD